jgi:hypothetical protein
MKCNLMTWGVRVLALTIVAELSIAEIRATVIDFEDVALSPGGYENGSRLSHAADGTGSFSSRGAVLNNYYDTTYGPYWEGWSCSQVTNTADRTFSNQYSAVTGGGYGGPTSNYAVAYQGWVAGPPTITFSQPQTVLGAYFTNTTYAYDTLENGNQFAHKFASGDWFKATVTGLDGSGNARSKDFYLADFRSPSSYIVSGWTWVDLTSLGNAVRSVKFELASSDTGDYGINTPTYFAMDNLAVVPEPSTFVLTLIASVAVWAWRWRRKSRWD